jgi:hypothetical protein
MGLSIKVVLSVAAPMLLVIGVALPTPVAAVGLGAALKTCQRNPGCTAGPAERDGGHTLLVHQSDGSTSVVECPPKGACFVVAAKPGAPGGKPPTGRASGVNSVLLSGAKANTVADQPGLKGPPQGGALLDGRLGKATTSPSPGRLKSN